MTENKGAKEVTVISSLVKELLGWRRTSSGRRPVPRRKWRRRERRKGLYLSFRRERSVFQMSGKKIRPDGVRLRVE